MVSVESNNNGVCGANNDNELIDAIDYGTWTKYL